MIQRNNSNEHYQLLSTYHTAMFSRALRLSLFYFTVVFLAGTIFGSIRVPFLLPAIGTRYAELLEMPLMMFVIWLSAQITISQLEADEYLTPIFIGALGLVWLVAMELATTIILQGGWWNGIRVYFVGRDVIAGPVYALAVMSYAIMPWYIWHNRKQETKVTIEFDGSVDEQEQPDHRYSWF